MSCAASRERAQERSQTQGGLASLGGVTLLTFPKPLPGLIGDDRPLLIVAVEFDGEGHFAGWYVLEDGRFRWFGDWEVDIRCLLVPDEIPA